MNPESCYSRFFWSRRDQLAAQRRERTEWLKSIARSY